MVAREWRRSGGVEETPWRRVGSQAGAAGARGSGAKGAATAEGAEEGEVVGGVEAAAGREALGEAGEGDFGKGLGDGLAEVVGGGFAFDVGAGGEDDFADGAGAEALEEGGDA